MIEVDDKSLENFFEKKRPVDVAKKLLRIDRSLVSDGLTKSHNLLCGYFDTEPFRRLHAKTGQSLPGGWIVPKKWKTGSAILRSSCGNFTVTNKEHNCRILIPSIPIKKKNISFEELRKHLFVSDSDTDFKYVTNYYKDDWGFSITKAEFTSVCKYNSFDVEIESSFIEDQMDILVSERQLKKYSFSSYLCHPQLANNELSGPILMFMLISYLEEYYPEIRKKCNFMVWPETIGAIAYQHIENNISDKHFILTCVGHKEMDLTLLEDKYKSSRLQRVFESILINNNTKYRLLPFKDRASDERQLYFGNIKREVTSLMANPYHSYPEYHTSSDNIDLLSNDTFYFMLKMYVEALIFLETDFEKPKSSLRNEPMLSKKGLKGDINDGGEVSYSGSDVVDVMCYSDGLLDIVDMSAYTKIPIDRIMIAIKKAKSYGWLI